MMLKMFGSRTEGRCCCETDVTPDPIDDESSDAWLLYMLSEDPPRLVPESCEDAGASDEEVPLLSWFPSKGCWCCCAPSFGTSRVRFSRIIVTNGRYSAAMRDCAAYNNDTHNNKISSTALIVYTSASIGDFTQDSRLGFTETRFLPLLWSKCKSLVLTMS
jgi:hypothetical protein